MGASWTDQNFKKSLFWRIIFSYSMQQWTISQSDCDVQWKVNFMWQPVMTNSVVEPRRSSRALSKAKFAPKEGRGHCLVVCCLSDLLQLSESWWNHYIWEVRSTNRWDAPKTAMPATSLGQERAQFFSITMSNHMPRNQCFKSWANCEIVSSEKDNLRITFWWL